MRFKFLFFIIFNMFFYILVCVMLFNIVVILFVIRYLVFGCNECIIEKCCNFFFESLLGWWFSYFFWILKVFSKFWFG